MIPAADCTRAGMQSCPRYIVDTLSGIVVQCVRRTRLHWVFLIGVTSLEFRSFARVTIGGGRRKSADLPVSTQSSLMY